MLDSPVVVAAPVPASWRGWAGVRVLLLALTPVVLLAALVWGRHSATLGDLQHDVENGRVAEVQVTGGMPPGASGTVRQDVLWHAGWQLRRAAVQLVVGQEASGTTWSDDAGSSVPVVREDVGETVRGWDPAVRVDRTAPGTDTSSPATVLGVGVPGWVGWLTLSQWLGAVLLLVRGPEPRRATRWGWFWLSAVPFGVTAFLLSSGPLPGRRPGPVGTTRLRGGKAFVVAVLLAGAFGGSGAL